MTESLKKQEELDDNKTDVSFHEYLLQKVDKYGFSESKKQLWVKQMSDTSQAEETVKSLMSYFHTNVKERFRVLDVGCGFGNLLIALQQHFAQVYGVEISKERVKWARKRASSSEVICADATRLPWPDGWFDLVLSTDVLEHISYQKQELVASELMRVLKRGGRGFITVPNRLQIFDEHNRVFFATYMPDLAREKYVKVMSKSNNYIHCWERTGSGWKGLLEDKGFQVNLKPIPLKNLKFLLYALPPHRYEIYLTK